MAYNLRASLEGAGIGFFGGLVIGISEADWLRFAIAIALITYAGKALQKNESNHQAAGSYRLAFTGLASFLAILIGFYITGFQVLNQTPKDAVTMWVNAGFTPAQAREIYLKQTNLKLQQINKNDRPAKEIISRMINPENSDFISGNKDSLSIRVDSLQALLNLLLADGSTSLEIAGNESSLESNLFSSNETQNLCAQLDPDLYPDTLSYFEAIRNTGIAELEALIFDDPGQKQKSRHKLAGLIWLLACTIESDTQTNWAEITDPV
ncbi:MAG: hypothetical protein CVU14_04655, partial [Bacteroidetes bacterium HGW-Bacteroidetes-9]